MSHIGWRYLQVDEKHSTLFLSRPGMGLDLGSVAKGYAADQAARVLRDHGVTTSLIDLGGNILTTGTKPDGSRWRIAIQNPEEPRGTTLGYVDITGGSVTTAGTYERFFDQDGKRYFHILDARTGYPAWNGLSAVAIVAPDSTTADGIDTLAFTLGLESGMRLVEETARAGGGGFRHRRPQGVRHARSGFAVHPHRPEVHAGEIADVPDGGGAPHTNQVRQKRVPNTRWWSITRGIRGPRRCAGRRMKSTGGTTNGAAMGSSRACGKSPAASRTAATA